MNTFSNIFEELSSSDESSSFDEFTTRSNKVELGENAKVDFEERNIFESLDIESKQAKDDNFDFLGIARDIGEQVASKGVAGAIGSYGNLLETAGLQLKPGEVLPGQKQINLIQSGILDKLERGEVPSAGELMLLSDDEGLPSGIRFPTSSEIQGGIEGLTGIGEGKTPAGRIAGRGASFLGETSVLPGAAIKPILGAAGAGIAGQSLREAGAPEILSTGTEIAGATLPSVLSGKLAPRSKEVKELVAGGRQLGLTEKQLTPLIQGEKKIATLSKISRKGNKSKNLFSSIKESLGDSYSTIKKSVAPIGKLSKENTNKLISKFQDISTDLNKTLKASPDKEQAIKFIDDAILKASNSGATPEDLINFWQDINKSVKWGAIEGGKKSLARLKEPILETLSNVAPEAAKDFDMTNKLYTKYAQISRKLKPDVLDTFSSKGEILGTIGGAISLASGNPWLLKTVASEAALRTLAREMLINPYFQNISNKLVTNLNSGSVKAVEETIKQAKEYLQRKHSNEDWSFLQNN